MRVPAPVLLILILLMGCGQQNEQRPETRDAAIDTTAVIAEGQKITQAAFQTLSSNLKQAMGEGGVEHAVQFCNIEAMPLTDSLATNFGVELRRASHRPRNPDNRADSLELASINKYLEQIEQEAELKPLVYAAGDQAVYHAPIRITNALCLSCHGKPGMDIQEDDLATIQKLYPNDEATGFEFGELRGIWSVNFPEAFFVNKEMKSEPE
ncbi:DUF3365 domain-containing protein [Aliifodinibius sp. S!AR15-10]|uniref:Tll0287-like domain-containing protein n=1 Tax=Aliifodinibius sp. S!AR15-10 TaxID=2950437 RepID=UPI00285C984B|nr:DUF3365 domain-containing protein [Aliifodinibius sp. S!AR15-10]MDR8394397.1 DUF3365 domain-containing protein [Aliifodinibius sp. S!AR15-10]